MNHIDNKYNFDQGARRIGTSCIKWDFQKEEFGRDGLIPFTIADADYSACPSVLEAVVKRTELGVLGYTDPGDDYYRAVCSWCEKRHSWKIDPSFILPVNGIIPGISYVLEALTSPGDSVVVQPPVYDPFYSVIQACRRTLLENPLIKDSANRYTMNLEQLETLFSHGAKVMILCSPHNPVGRVWTKDELAAVARLCIKYQVLLISDEIHWDIILGDNPHTTMGSYQVPGLKLIVCTSGSKTFNIAGLQTANFIIPDATLKDTLRKWLDARYLFCPNVLGLAVTQAAYETGADWLDAQLRYLKQNLNIALDFLQKKLPQVTISALEGTYLLWMDFTYTRKTSEELISLFARHGAALGNGLHYGAGHDGFIRMNLACPASQLKQGLEYILSAIEAAAKEESGCEPYN